MNTGSRLKQLRKHYKLTGDEVAEICGVSKGRVSQWESGKGEPSMAQVRMLKTVMDFTCDWLIDGLGTPPWETDQSLQALYAVAQKLPHYAVIKLTKEGLSYAELIKEAGSPESNDGTHG